MGKEAHEQFNKIEDGEEKYEETLESIELNLNEIGLIKGAREGDIKKYTDAFADIWNEIIKNNDENKISLVCHLLGQKTVIENAKFLNNEEQKCFALIYDLIFKEENDFVRLVTQSHPEIKFDKKNLDWLSYRALDPEEELEVSKKISHLYQPIFESIVIKNFSEIKTTIQDIETLIPYFKNKKLRPLIDEKTGDRFDYVFKAWVEEETINKYRELTDKISFLGKFIDEEYRKITDITNEFYRQREKSLAQKDKISWEGKNPFSDIYHMFGTKEAGWGGEISNWWTNFQKNIVNDLESYLVFSIARQNNEVEVLKGQYDKRAEKDPSPRYNFTKIQEGVKHIEYIKELIGLITEVGAKDLTYSPHKIKT